MAEGHRESPGGRKIPLHEVEGAICEACERESWRATKGVHGSLKDRLLPPLFNLNQGQMDRAAGQVTALVHVLQAGTA